MVTCMHGTFRVLTAQGKQGKWSKAFPVREKDREFGNVSKTQGKNTGNSICSSCKLPHFKKRMYRILRYLLLNLPIFHSQYFI